MVFLCNIAHRESVMFASDLQGCPDPASINLLMHCIKREIHTNWQHPGMLGILIFGRVYWS